MKNCLKNKILSKILAYEKISDKLIRIRIICSVDVQGNSLISENEINFYFELAKKDKDHMIPLDEWIYIKVDKK
jgi:hypothetical protein